MLPHFFNMVGALCILDKCVDCWDVQPAFIDTAYITMTSAFTELPTKQPRWARACKSASSAASG